MKTALVLGLCAGLLQSTPVTRQPPRDAPPPAIEMARRERDLRAAIAAGTATKDTYLELAAIAKRQNRYGDAIEAARAAAALEPDSAETQHWLGTFCWDAANKTESDPATKLTYIRCGLTAEDRALALKPDYAEAMTYKNILLRLQANLATDPAERARLIAEADALRNRVLDMRRQEQPQRTTRANPENTPDEAAPFTGFSEPFEQTFARIQPVRVGGNIPQPTKLQDRKPVYPQEAQAARVQGVVIIEALIDESGSIANARILRSIPMLDQAALSAVSGWRFTPTEANGRPSGVLMTVTVNFTLQ